jgi:hypothetical protein
VSRPIIEVSTDLAGGIVLSTSDRWLVEDACESVAKAISPKAFVSLAVALDGHDLSNLDSLVHLDQAREMVSTETQNKSIVLARLLPFEILGLIKSLNDALEKSA